MKQPIAMKLNEIGGLLVYNVNIDPHFVHKVNLCKPESTQAIMVVQEAAVFPNLNAGMIDTKNILAIHEGNWENAILVVLPKIVSTGFVEHRRVAQLQSSPTGDNQFMAHVRQLAPGLQGVAKRVLSDIRAAGVAGELVERGAGRWVNSPLNTFTLKVQHKVNNLAFTLYGNPESYISNGFLHKDQNSYSRGWIKNFEDAETFVGLVKQSHARRAK